MTNLITIKDISLSEVEGEPRAYDLDLAERLGYPKENLRDIRKLINRYEDELAALGTRATVARVIKGKRGSTKAYEHWLTEEQALLIAMRSDAENSASVRTMLIRVFVAWRRGHLAPVQPAANQNHAREARLFFKQAMGIAKIAGLTGNSMLIAANRATRAAVGFDQLDAMGVKYLEAPDNDVLLTATDIGKRLGALSAIRVNHILSEHGFQTGERDAKGHPMWLPTERGIAAGGQMVEVERSNKTGQARQLRWASRIVDTLRDLIEGRAA